MPIGAVRPRHNPWNEIGELQVVGPFPEVLPTRGRYHPSHIRHLLLLGFPLPGVLFESCQVPYLRIASASAVAYPGE